MRIALLYNDATELSKGVIGDLLCEKEILVIAPLIKAALEKAGHSVVCLSSTIRTWDELEKLRNQVDLVFNLAEGFGGTNTDEPLIAAKLEALRIPFTGASCSNIYLTLDKEKSKLVLSGYGLSVPAYQIVRDTDQAISPPFDFPMIVKPIREEASIGITYESVVCDEARLRSQARHVLSTYKQPALVEPYIGGREISIGLLGNAADLAVLDPLEFLFPDAASPLQAFRSYEYKWGGKKEVMVRADIDPLLRAKLIEAARTAFIATECRDYARIDFRVRGSEWYLLEVNHNPGIGPNSHGLNNTLTMMASFHGWTFDLFVNRIVEIAARRCALQFQ